MEIGNLKLFPNRRRTRELLKSGKYEELLQSFQVPLADWQRGFNAALQVPPQLRHVLTIEYEYTRVYVNSLALQAVVERCTHNTPQQSHAQPNGMGAPSSKTEEGGAIPFSTLVRWYGNDRHHIRQVVDASRNVLSVVVDGLYPDYLRHAPVRTFFRIVSVAIILLKTFALGATEQDVSITLSLLDRAVYALRTSIVDDVHVGNRFADLVDTLTHRIRGRFVRLAANGSTGISRAGTPPRSRAETPMNTAMGPPSYMPANPTGPTPNYPFGAFTGSSRPGSPGIRGITASGRATPIPQDPLFGISSESYDPTSNQISIMPPPGFSTNGLNNGNNGWQSQSWGAANGAGGFTDNQDWLALPLDPLLDQWGADINQTAMGPDVGGMDMLDILLNMGGPPGSA
ncbi:zinc finger transcriptional activator [Kalmusia sp. IMI 367209]|nr:zinc finger transcriptional activator [Kalmusia sp. IMI 367209]